jgi:hypothetical protein
MMTPEADSPGGIEGPLQRKKLPFTTSRSAEKCSAQAWSPTSYLYPAPSIETHEDRIPSIFFSWPQVAQPQLPWPKGKHRSC